MSSTPNFGLPLVPPNVADPSTPVNDSLMIVDAKLKQIQDEGGAGGPTNPAPAELPDGGNVGEVLKVQSVNPRVLAWGVDIVGTGGGGGGGGSNPGTGGAHRAWRVRITDSATGNSGINDIQFRTQSGVNPGSPTGGAIIASKEDRQNKEQVFDNDLNSSSYPGWGATGLNEWVGYDYVTPIKIVEIRLRNNWDENAKAVAVEFTDGNPSDPASVWSTVVERPVSFSGFNGELVFPLESVEIPYLIDPGGGTDGDALKLKIDAEGNRSLAWEPVGGGGGAGSASPYSRYRIAVMQTRNATGPGFAEIIFRDAAGAGKSITAAEASQELSGYEIAKGYDGNPSTLYTTGRTAVQDVPTQIDFTFASPFQLGSILITPRQDGYEKEVPIMFGLYGRSSNSDVWHFISVLTQSALKPASNTADLIFNVG